MPYYIVHQIPEHNSITDCWTSNEQRGNLLGKTLITFAPQKFFLQLVYYPAFATAAFFGNPHLNETS